MHEAVQLSRIATPNLFATAPTKASLAGRRNDGGTDEQKQEHSGARSQRQPEAVQGPEPCDIPSYWSNTPIAITRGVGIPVTSTSREDQFLDDYWVANCSEYSRLVQEYRRSGMRVPFSVWTGPVNRVLSSRELAMIRTPINREVTEYSRASLNGNFCPLRAFFVSRWVVHLSINLQVYHSTSIRSPRAQNIIHKQALGYHMLSSSGMVLACLLGRESLPSVSSRNC